jgi:hypothetical protein
MLRPMASPPRTREEERRLNARTLAIASAASASSAAVTSQLWIAGTWIAAAITPLIVATVSELLHRPSERIARAITSDRPALQLDDPDEAAALSTRPDPDASGPAPVRVYRQPSVPPASRRRFAVRVVVITTVAGLLIGAAALTAVELIAGQSIGKGNGATSLVGGKPRGKRASTTDERTPAPAGQDTTTDEAPATTPEEPRTVTVTVPTETTPAPTSTTPTAPETAP